MLLTLAPPLVSTAVVETAEATIPAVARYPAMVVIAAGNATGAANKAPPMPPRTSPALRIFLKNDGVGEVMRFFSVNGSFFMMIRFGVSGVRYRVSAVGYQVSGIRYQQSEVGSRLSVNCGAFSIVISKLSAVGLSALCFLLSAFSAFYLFALSGA